VNCCRASVERTGAASRQSIGAVGAGGWHLHEYSIVQALVDRVSAEARSHRASSVSRLTVRIGELAGVETSLLSAAFLAFRGGTICEGADLVIQTVAARWECPRCGNRIDRGEVLACRTCGVPAHLAEGDEIVLDRIEMEVS
jgi:hydrogenase nickel incorporation protein HypA/HybF